MSFNSVGNGANNTHLIMNGVQSRAWGWQYRNRARAWWTALDSSPEKDLFYKSLEDAVAQRVGIYDIPGVMVGNPIRDSWNTNHMTWYSSNTPIPRPNALHYWEKRGGYTVSAADLDDTGGSGQASWMRNFITLSLYHAVELGVELARPLADWTAYQTILVANSTEPRHIADYITPDLKNT